MSKNRLTRNYPVVWLTGQSGSGKTTLAHELQKLIGGVILDGDEMRESVSLGSGFSKRAREEHNLRVARLANVLARQMPVIVSVIAPFESTRAKVHAIAHPFWVYVERAHKKRKDYPYEIPSNPHCTVESNVSTPFQNARKVKKALLSSRSAL